MVGLISLAAALFLTARILSSFDGDVTVFAAFGVEAPAILEYAEARLGEVVTRGGTGHDGRFFFVQANDPLLLNPDQHAVHLDRPAYRSQRMLYPLLAGGLGLFPPSSVVWGMVVVNVLALGVGGWATARFARDAGLSSWWGVAFPLNIGLIFELITGGGGLVAFTAGMWGLVAMQRERLGWSALALTAAVLAREAMLVMVAGAAFWWWLRRRRVPLVVVGTPLAVAACWAGYLQLRLGGLRPEAAHIEEIGLPFGGFLGVLQSWSGYPENLVVGLTIAAILVMFTIRTLRSGDLLGWSSIGFVPLAIVLTSQVWFGYFDISRAVAPVLTAWVITSFAGRRSTTPSEPVP